MHVGPELRSTSASSGFAVADAAGQPTDRGNSQSRHPAQGRLRQRTALDLLLGCGVLGPPLFVFVFLLEGATRPGYDPWRHAVSQLSLGELGWVNITALVVFGLFMLAFARGLGQQLHSGTGSTWAPRLIAIFGLSLIIAGVFVIDPSLGYPPGRESVHTLHGLVHAIDGLFLFGSLSAASLVLARRFEGDPLWTGWAPYSIVTGVAVAAFFIACVVVTSLDQNGILSPAPGGLLQRISLISGLGWITALALRLARGQAGRPRTD